MENKKEYRYLSDRSLDGPWSLSAQDMGKNILPFMGIGYSLLGL
jgi:hypothetical protein